MELGIYKNINEISNAITYTDLIFFSNKLFNKNNYLELVFHIKKFLQINNFLKIQKCIPMREKINPFLNICLRSENYYVHNSLNLMHYFWRFMNRLDNESLMKKLKK